MVKNFSMTLENDLLMKVTILVNKLKSDITFGEPVVNLSLPRGLDYWGIFSGPLLEGMAMLPV